MILRSGRLDAADLRAMQARVLTHEESQRVVEELLEWVEGKADLQEQIAMMESEREEMIFAHPGHCDTCQDEDCEGADTVSEAGCGKRPNKEEKPDGS